MSTLTSKANLFLSCQKKHHWSHNLHRTSLPAHGSLQLLMHQLQLRTNLVVGSLPWILGINEPLDLLNATVFLRPEVPIHLFLNLAPWTNPRFVLDFMIEMFLAEETQGLIIVPLDSLNIGPGL